MPCEAPSTSSPTDHFDGLPILNPLVSSSFINGRFDIGGRQGRFMASCLAHLGRLKEAEELVKRLQAITPVVIPTAEHWRIPEDREYFLHGLRLAVGVAPEDVANHKLTLLQ